MTQHQDYALLAHHQMIVQLVSVILTQNTVLAVVRHTNVNLSIVIQVIVTLALILLTALQGLLEHVAMESVQHAQQIQIAHHPVFLIV